MYYTQKVIYQRKCNTREKGKRKDKNKGINQQQAKKIRKL